MDSGKSAAGKQSKPNYFDAAARGATAKHRLITPEPGMSQRYRLSKHQDVLLA